MSNIIFNKKLQPSNDKRFFGLPVRVIKVLLRFCDKPELNHFERAIMALSLYQRYSIADLSEMLQLKIELIELIINNLKKKSFMDEEQKVTQKGEEILKNFHKNFKDEVCYVFYDLNRKCLLQEYCSPSDIIEIEGEKNSFNLENDAFSEEVIFTPIIKSNENFKIDNDIEGYIKRDIFYNNDKTLINVEILNVDYNKYFFISYIESSKDLSDNRWIIANPVTLEQDTALYDYFYENTNVESINKLIMGIIQFKKKSFNEDENKLYEKIGRASCRERV